MSEMKKLDVPAYRDLLDFAEWLREHPNLVLASWLRLDDRGEPRRTPLLVPCPRSAIEIIYEYLGVDAAELERERRALLSEIRERNMIADELDRIAAAHPLSLKESA